MNGKRTAICLENDMAEKCCSKCGEVKLVSQFCKKASSLDGLSPHCKACRKIYNKKYHAILAAELGKYDVRQWLSQAVLI